MSMKLMPYVRILPNGIINADGTILIIAGVGVLASECDQWNIYQ